MKLKRKYKYYGDISAVPPERSVLIYCDNCEICFTGCWDNFLCPECGEGELPSFQQENV